MASIKLELNLIRPPLKSTVQNVVVFSKMRLYAIVTAVATNENVSTVIILVAANRIQFA